MRVVKGFPGGRRRERGSGFAGSLVVFVYELSYTVSSPTFMATHTRDFLVVRYLLPLPLGIDRLVSNVQCCHSLHVIFFYFAKLIRFRVCGQRMR